MRDVARCFNDVRSRTWCDPQLQILDLLIEMISDEFSEHGVSDDELERFSRTARIGEDRAKALNPYDNQEGRES